MGNGGRSKTSPANLLNLLNLQVENQQAANTKQQASLPRHRSYESGAGRQASTAKAKAASGRPVKGGNGAGKKGTSISET
jgi:hypothetical protein